MDQVGKKLLMHLQRDCMQSVAEMGAAVGLSASACHRRVKQLEEGRFITGTARGSIRRQSAMPCNSSLR